MKKLARLFALFSILWIITPSWADDVTFQDSRGSEVTGTGGNIRWWQDVNNITYRGGPIPFLFVGNQAMFGYPANAIVNIYADLGQPTTVQSVVRAVVQAKGDNTTFIGARAGQFIARDRTDVTPANKGVLYAMSLEVVPSQARNNVPFDDVDGLTISNTTGTIAAKATDAIYVSNNTFAFGDRLTGTSEWYSIFTADNNADVGIALNGKLATFGIDLGLANLPTGSAMRVPNNTFFVARNAANNANLNLIGLDANNIVRLGGTNVSGVQVTSAWFGATTPTTQGGATYTIAFADNWVTFTGAGCTVTLPAAGSFAGRILHLRTTTANAVISASSNVVPLAGGAAGTTILAATAGKWATLVSDSANWQTMEGN